MKKLMTMIAAAAMAFGLYATGSHDAGFISGTAFEVGDGGTSFENGALVAGYWDGATNGFATVQEGSHTFTLEGSRPKQFDLYALNTTNLAIATTLGNPVFHNVNSSGLGEPIGGGLYFDSLVKFTLFDPEDEPTADDAKIAVYPQLASEDDGAKAYLTVLAKNASGEATRFTTATEIAADTWYRLTIKAIANIDGKGQTGFMVFVNGAAANSEDAEITSGLLPKYADWGARGKIFLSMGNAATVEAVGFDGKGEVDEIAFTTTAPAFAVDPAMYKADWSAINGKFDTVSVDGVEVTDPAELAQGFAWRTIPQGDTATISWTGKDNYMDGDKDLAVSDNDEFTLEATDIVEAKALFNTTKFAEVADAVSYANTNGTLGTVTLLADAVVNQIAITTANTTIDLAGKALTLTAEESGLTGTIILANSVTEGYAVITGDCTSVAGTFAQDNYNIRFDKDHNTWQSKSAVGLDVPDGYEWGEDGDYYVLKEKAKTFTVTVPALTTGLLIQSITTNNVPVAAPAAGDYTLIENQNFTMTYVADDANGYEFTEQTETGIRDATTTKTIEPPTVALKQFTVTYMVDGQKDSEEPVTWGAKPKAVPTPDPKTGYTGAWDEDPADAVIKADKTFTYTYTAVNYSITYTTGNGTEVTNGVKSYTIETETFNLPVAADIDMKSVEGVTFVGWTNATSNVVVDKVTKGTTGNLEFFAKWEAVAPAEKDPTDDDPTVIDPAEKAGDRYGDKVPTTLANVSAKSIATWAQGNGKLVKDAEILENAFLLNCENTEAAINAAKANFKATSITVNSDGTVTVGEPTGTYNGTIKTLGKAELSDAEWSEVPTGKKFFELKLVPANLN